MSLGTALDVAIGLILTYLLLGLFASSCQEMFVGIVKLRGHRLFGALDELLADGMSATDPRSLAYRVKSHSLIRPLGSDELPSYLPAKSFALALLDRLSEGKQTVLVSEIEVTVGQLPDSSVKTSLVAYLKRAGNDVNVLQTYIQTWFDDAMDRASGDYKRWSQYFLLAFGMAVAVVLNVDTIHIVTTLWVEPAARATLVEAAATVTRAVAPTSSAGTAGTTDIPMGTAGATAAMQQLQALPVPIGWTEQTSNPGSTSNPVVILYDAVFSSGSSGIWRVLGWLLTAFGVSMGAPFWFNVLQQALKLRAAGPKPSRADASSSN